MKKRYTFLAKNWLRFGLTAAFAGSLSFSASSQIGPAKQWDKTFGGSGEDVIYSLQQTSDGGYILGGTSKSALGGDKSQASRGLSDMWVVKLDKNGNKIWDKTFGGSDDDFLFSLRQTADGGYLLGGASSSGIGGDKTQANKGTEDYWIIKIDSLGNKTWDKSFGGNSFDRLMSLQQTSDGGYILGGSSSTDINGDKSQPSKGSSDYWIIKLDSNGNKIWDKSIGGTSIEGFYSLEQTLDGGYILNGYSSSDIGGDKTQFSIGGDDFWIVKLDSVGNRLWDKTLGGNGYEYISKIRQTSDGGYILGGRSDSGIGFDKSQASKGNYDYWVLKLNANGNKIWDKTIGGSDADYFSDLQQTSDGGYILGGTSISSISGDKTQSGSGAFDYWIVKLDGGGNKLWDRTIGGRDNEGFSSLQQTSDGGFILGGSSLSGITGDKSQIAKGDYDFWIVKLAAEVTGIKEPEANFNVFISPNPNQGKFTLQLSNLTSAKAEVTVSDLLGRVVLQQQLNVSNKQLSEELILPHAKGLYLLHVKAGEQVITRKIVVE